MTGLLKSDRGKGNMERIEEEIDDLEYHQCQHFISNSPWDHQEVLSQVREDVNRLMEEERLKTGSPTGLIIDESAHLKKGSKSVGVSRQYAGIIGKVEHCQVGVYVSLCTGERSSLVHERLFLPESWSEDSDRCEEARIPQEFRVHQTKPVLALEMIDRCREEGIVFDWVGGDGLYGHGYEFAQALEDRGLLFVLDVHKNQLIFMEPPTINLIEKKGSQEHDSTQLKTDDKPIRADKYAQQLSNGDWKKTRIRKTTKGWLKAWIHVKEVWVWDAQETEARKRTLILQKTILLKGETQEIKYSLSNGRLEEYSLERLAYFQAQRFWIERDFENGKSELAMSDYQVRKWQGWHHHHAIVFMAMLFMLKERIEHETQYPLMSFRDARIVVTTLIAQTILENETKIQRQIRFMEKRHHKRKMDIERHYVQDG